MSNQMFPIKQTFVDEKLANGEQIVITRVNIVNATTSYVLLPNADDAQLLQTARTTADLDFYLSNRSTRFNLDGGTVGTEQGVVSRHSGMLNYDRGDQASGDPVS